MQSIADKAGVPKSNVHYYFGNKRSLYNAVLEDVVGLWDQAFETLNPDDDSETGAYGFCPEESRIHPALSSGNPNIYE